MKTVKQLKSYPLSIIPDIIDKEVRETIEGKRNEYNSDYLKRHPETRDLPESARLWNESRADWHTIGVLQSQLTIAIMELKHKENVENEVKTQIKIS